MKNNECNSPYEQNKGGKTYNHFNKCNKCIDKISMKYHFTTFKMTVWRKGKPCAYWWECSLEQTLWRAVGRYLKKIKNRILILSTNPTSGINKNRNQDLEETSTPPCSLQHYSQYLIYEKQTMYLSMDEWIKKYR